MHVYWYVCECFECFRDHTHYTVPKLVVMRRDLNTYSRQSAMHHGVRVRVFFRRSSEYHSRNDSSRAAAHLGVTTYMFFFLIFVLVTFLRVLYSKIHHHVNQRSKLHTYNCSAEVPVLHTPVEVMFSMTCRFVHGQGKRGNAHIPAIMWFAFPDVVVLDSFI